MRAPAAAPRRFCCVPPTALEAKLAAAPLLQRRQRQRAATASAKASAAAPIVDDTVDRGRNRPVRFVLVRHGQSTWNAEGRIQGSSDISVLTEKGKRQAREAAELRELLRLEALAMTHYFKFKHTKIERLFKLSK